MVDDHFPLSSLVYPHTVTHSVLHTHSPHPLPPPFFSSYSYLQSYSARSPPRAAPAPHPRRCCSPPSRRGGVCRGAATAGAGSRRPHWVDPARCCGLRSSVKRKRKGESSKGEDVRVQCGKNAIIQCEYVFALALLVALEHSMISLSHRRVHEVDELL